jgi:zinc transporter, ZIP family
MNGTVEMAFLLTILAGLSTGIGSLIAMLLKDNKNTNYLTFSMSFAAGVMLFVSFVEILPHATHELEEIYGKEGHEHFGAILATICFFGGIFLVALIDKLIPKGESPHEFISQKDMESGVESPVNKKKLMRVGTLAAVALALHNFPEGIATFTAALNDVQMGATIAVAIALHNIPEGIAVSMPIYYATGSRKKAFFYSFLSGIVEPLGAFLAYAIFGSYMTDSTVVMPAMLAAVAGIMVFISLDQLLPAAEEYGHHHLSTYGVVSGMAVMAMSLLLLPHEH